VKSTTGAGTKRSKVDGVRKYDKTIRVGW